MKINNSHKYMNYLEQSHCKKLKIEGNEKRKVADTDRGIILSFNHY